MHPSDKQWWLAHTGDYVLGLLSNPDRLVLERIMQTDPDVTQLVNDWRETLYPLTDAVPELDPPEHVLESLTNNLPPQPNPQSLEHSDTQRLSAEQTSDPETLKLAETQAQTLADGTAFQRLLETKQTALEHNEKSANGWRSFAGLATVACIFTGVLGWVAYKGMVDDVSEQSLASTQFDAISIVEDASAKPLWIVDAMTEQKQLRVTAISPPELEPGKAFELWANNSDRTVASMGLLPLVANESVLITANDFDGAAQAFSVSLESEEGSATKLPSGPIVYRGLIESLSSTAQ